jgi:PAS domain S-box-containing protein
MLSDSKVNILLVDDYPENLLALETILEGLGENLVRATSGEEALRCLLHQSFAVILLDVQMPGIDGFETAGLIRSRARSRETPIIFLTAFSTAEQLMFKGYSLGAVDYLLKPIDPMILTSKVSVFVDLFKKTEAVKRQTEEVERQAAQLQAMNNELKRSEERFRLLSACSPVGIFVTNTEGHCVYTNPRVQTICGFTPNGNLGDTWIPFIHLDDQDQVLEKWSIYMREGKDFSDEFRLQMEDGTIRWVNVRSSPMRSDENELLGHVGTIEDITERKQMEAVRQLIVSEQSARREAEVANRMKDEFLAVLSHELRTPLNSMLGWSRLLRTRKFDEATTARALETIERNAVTQAQLIEDILDVSQIIRGKLRLKCGPTDLTTVIQSAIEAVRPQSEAKAIQLEWALSEPIDLLWGDPVRLQQVVWNLLTNAIKFTPEAGRVEVKLEKIECSMLSAEVDSLEQEDNVGQIATAQRLSCFAQITVTDTGVGISPDFLPKVFDRFRQADSTTTRSHNGLGLGLAIVRHLVELHGGTVHAASEGEGLGATFTVKLPLLQDELSFTTTSTAQMSECQGQTDLLKGVKVLLVDDMVDTREFLTFALQQYGAMPIGVDSVEAAMTAYQTQAPDIVISDIGMPGQNGYTLIQQLRSLNHQQKPFPIPIIALTAYSGEDDQKQMQAAGFQAHFAKPVDIYELVKAIAQLTTCAT